MRVLEDVGARQGRLAPDTLRNLFNVFWGEDEASQAGKPVSILAHYRKLAFDLLLHDQGRYRLQPFQLGKDLHLDQADSLFLWHQFTLRAGASLLPAILQINSRHHLSPLLVDPVGDELNSILAEHSLVECHVHAGSAFLVEEVWLNFLQEIAHTLLNGKPLPWATSIQKEPLSAQLKTHIQRRGLLALLVRYTLFAMLRKLLDQKEEDELFSMILSWSKGDKPPEPSELDQLRDKVFTLQEKYYIEREETLPLEEEGRFLQECLQAMAAVDETTRHPEETKLHQLFWHYVRLKAWFLQQHIQFPRREGFSFFRENYYIPLKRLGDARWQKIPHKQLQRWQEQLSAFQRMLGMELRCAPGIHDVNEMLDLAQAAADMRTQNPSMPQLGIIVHFIKPDQCEKSHKYEEFLAELRHQLTQLQELLQMRHHEGVVRHLVGIDVANVETNAPNWLFLPIFVEFRSWWRREMADLPTPGYTFHAGEEYLTLAQGLRHMDEVVSFFPWEANDRLGHGLALGDQPARWLRRHSLVPVTLEHLLLDRIWEWRMHAERDIPLPWHQRRMLEQEIRALADEFLQPAQPLSTEQWLLFYKALFCPQVVLEALDHPSSWEGVLWYQTEVAEQLRQDKDTWQIFRKYLRSRPQMANPIRHWRPLFELQEEAKRYQAIQEEMLHRFAKKRLAIECCPSSNVMIRDMDRYRDHPLVRIRKKIPVLLNTDNPAIFGTTLDMELALLYHALAQPGEADNKPEGYSLAEREEIIREFVRNNHTYTFIPAIRQESKRMRLLYGS
ncbi:MAG: hypothetical protein HQL55_13945 [Magnetococcales bacterium]|nr:hypothetical protein [Magnetococcales bacterium]